MSSATYELPSHLKSSAVQSFSPVALEGSAKVEFSPSELTRLESSLNLARMSAEDSRALAKIGIQSQALGIMDGIHGDFFVTKKIVYKQMAALQAITEDVGIEESERHQARELLAMWVEKLIKINLAEVKVDTSKAHVEIAAQQVGHRASSWVPNEDVKPKIVG